MLGACIRLRPVRSATRIQYSPQSPVLPMVNRPFLALFVRIAIALGTWTFFQPDEYYQSLEVAHHLVFGYGQLTWEWLAPKPIRSIIYPALNVPVYWLLKVLALDGTSALVGAYCVVRRGRGVLRCGADLGP